MNIVNYIDVFTLLHISEQEVYINLTKKQEKYNIGIDDLYDNEIAEYKNVSHNGMENIAKFCEDFLKNYQRIKEN